MMSENTRGAKRDQGRISRKIKQEIMESRRLSGWSGRARKKGKRNNGRPVVVVIEDSDDEDGDREESLIV
jgi:hypothetical protein